MIEFTGERVVPGEVEPDLWNEHFSRYLFAARLARGKRVIDLGCGTGYGANELARTAATVTGVDVHPATIAHAQQTYRRDNLSYLTASSEQVPLPDASADLIIAFELIEHLASPERLLAEANRLLAPGGQFIVSTPNREYYSISREEPNPYHQHEFDYAEFRAALETTFPHVALFTQNHVSALLFQPLEAPASTSLRLDPNPAGAANAHFYLAVCAQAAQVGSPNFLYVPATSNILHERESHIRKLEGELKTKQQWLTQALADHEALVEQHRTQLAQLQAANAWAQERDLRYQEKAAHVTALEAQLAEAHQNIHGYRAETARLETTQRQIEAALTEARTQHAAIAATLESKLTELSRCVQLLHQAEAELDSRTHWALELETQKQNLEERLRGASASRWIRLGRAFHLGPNLNL